MALRKVGPFNDISPELMPAIPTKPTQVSYRFLDGFTDPIRKTKHFKTEVLLPPTSQFFDTIKKAWIPIGLVEAVDASGTPTRIQREILRQYPQQFAGHVHLQVGAGSAPADALYQYLELASFVISNKGRDTNMPAILERVDFAGEAADKRKKRELSFEAYRTASELSDDEAVRAAMVLGLAANQTIEDIRNHLESEATARPEAFLERLSDPHASAKADCITALNKGHLVVDHKSKTLQWGTSKGVIMGLNSLETLPVATQFAEFVALDEKGPDILRMLNKHMGRVDAKAAAKKTKGEVDPLS